MIFLGKLVANKSNRVALSFVILVALSINCVKLKLEKMSSIVSFPGGARRLLEVIIIGLEGESVAGSPYRLSLSGWSGWRPFVPLSVPLA